MEKNQNILIVWLFFKKKAEQERSRIYRQRQKLGLINTKQTSTTPEVSLQDEGIAFLINNQNIEALESRQGFAIKSQQANRSGWSNC